MNTPNENNAHKRLGTHLPLLTIPLLAVFSVFMVSGNSGKGALQTLNLTYLCVWAMLLIIAFLSAYRKYASENKTNTWKFRLPFYTTFVVIILPIICFSLNIPKNILYVVLISIAVLIVIILVACYFSKMQKTNEDTELEIGASMLTFQGIALLLLNEFVKLI